MRFMSELVLRLVDAVSAPARQMRQSINGITTAIRETNTAALEASSKSLGRTMRGVTVDLAGAAAGLVAYTAALAKPIGAATEFEAKLTTIGQKAEMKRGAVMKMGVSIRALSVAVNQSSKDVAEGVDVLAGAGLDPAVALRLLDPIGRAATAYKAEIGDLANASYAVYENLKIPIQDVGLALDVMAVAGKKGKFELADMARYFPSLAASAQGLKQSGVAAVADLSAALQVALRGAGSADEAATNVGNLMQKIRAPQTVKAFDKMGVDLVASLNRLEAEGRTPIEAIAELTNKTLGGDLSRLGYLFEDAQVQKALRPLIDDMEDYRKIRAQAMAGQGTVMRDWVERMKDAEAKQNAAKIAADNLKVAFGAALLPAVGQLAGALTPLIQGLTAFITAHPKLVSNVTMAIGAYLAYQVATAGFTLLNLASKKGLVDLALGFLGAGNGATSAAGLVGRAGGAIRGALGGVVGLATRVADGLILGVAGGGLKAFGMLERLRGLSFAGVGRSILGLGRPLGAFAARIAGLPGLAIRSMLTAGGAVKGFLSLLSPSSIVGFGRALVGLLNPVTLVRGALSLLRLALIGTGIGVIIVGIGLAAALVIQHWRGFVTFFQGVGRGFAAAIAPVRPALEPFIQGIKALFGWLGSFFKGKPGEDWSQYGVAVGKALGGAVLGLVNFARWVGECITKVKEFFGIKGKPPSVGVPGLGGGKPAESAGEEKPKGWFGSRRLPGRAKGGPVSAGQDYIVGEEGVEVVRFDTPGRVFPNGVRPPAERAASQDIPVAAKARRVPAGRLIAPVLDREPAIRASAAETTTGGAAALPLPSRPAPVPAAPAARASPSRSFSYAPTFNVYGANNPADLVEQAIRDLKRQVEDLWQGGLFDTEVRSA